MDSFTLNKIAGAVLGTCLVGMGIGIVADEIYAPKTPKKPGFALPEGEKEGGAGGKKSDGPTLPALLAKADPKRGESSAKVCGACHNFEEGAGAKIGPDLYGVVDRPKGSVQGFDYSAGMKKKGGKWTFADLNEFLTKPSAYVQGTKMGYAGEENPEKRADIIVYLRSLSKKPAELPKVSEADKKGAAGGGEAKKEGGGEDELIKLIGAADPKKGASDAQVCGACHNFKKGEGAKIGPDLYGVVDRPKGSAEGFDYSAGMKKKGGKWTYADLNQFLTKPSAYVQGTKMGYAGEANEKKRASIIAYLRSLADTPAPLPKANEKAGGDDKKADAGKPAEGGKDAAAGGGGFAKLVAAADPKKGKSTAQVCGACHSLDKNGGTLVGPHLWGVVDRDKGSVEGFAYSAGMKKKGGKWTYDDLNQFLTKPSAYVQGTKMGYGGESNEKKRAEIVAFLRTLADKPAPLPGADEKKAEGDKPAPEKAAAKPDDKKAAAPPPAKPAAPAPEKKSDSKPQAPSEPAKPEPAKPEDKKAEDKKAAAPPPPPPPPPAKPEDKKADAPPPPPPAAKPDDKKADAPPPPPPPAKPEDKKADAPPPPPADGKAASEGPAPYSAPSPSDAPAAPAEPEDKKADAPALPPLTGDTQTKGGGTEPYSAPSPGEGN